VAIGAGAEASEARCQRERIAARQRQFQCSFIVLVPFLVFQKWAKNRARPSEVLPMNYGEMGSSAVQLNTRVFPLSPAVYLSIILSQCHSSTDSLLVPPCEKVKTASSITHRSGCNAQDPPKGA